MADSPRMRVCGLRGQRHPLRPTVTGAVLLARPRLLPGLLDGDGDLQLLVDELPGPDELERVVVLGQTERLAELAEREVLAGGVRAHVEHVPTEVLFGLLDHEVDLGVRVRVGVLLGGFGNLLLHLPDADAVDRLRHGFRLRHVSETQGFNDWHDSTPWLCWLTCSRWEEGPPSPFGASSGEVFPPTRGTRHRRPSCT